MVKYCTQSFLHLPIHDNFGHLQHFGKSPFRRKVPGGRTQGSRFSCYLNSSRPSWEPIQVPAAPLLIQCLDNILWKQCEVVQILRFLHSHESSRQSFRLLTLVWSFLAIGAILSVNKQMSLPLYKSVFKTNQTSKSYFFLKRSRFYPFLKLFYFNRISRVPCFSLLL